MPVFDRWFGATIRDSRIDCDGMGNGRVYVVAVDPTAAGNVTNQPAA